MRKTYQSIQAQIAILQGRADLIRKKEAKGVIDRIRTAIDEYGITASDLGFGSNGAVHTVPRQAPKAVVKLTRKKQPSLIRFADDRGNIWSGKGSQPRWLRAYVTEGKAKEDYRLAKPKIRRA